LGKPVAGATGVFRGAGVPAGVAAGLAAGFAAAGFGVAAAGVFNAADRVGCGIATGSSLGPIVRSMSMPAIPTSRMTRAKMRTGRLIFSIPLSLSAAAARA
jgi:hypothetical protein